MEEVVATLVEVVEEVTVMALLQQHQARDIQVLLAAVEATLVEAVEEVSLVVEEVEATATALLLPHQALPTLHPHLVPVLTQPHHRVQAPPMDLPLGEVVAYPAMEEEVVEDLEVEEEVVEDMGEGVGSLVLRCRRRAVSKFPNKLQFR